MPISIDTYKSKVAEATLVQAGADLVNDIWGIEIRQKKIAGVIAKYNVACCLMHNRDNTRICNFLDDFYGGYAGVYTSGKGGRDCR